jgi:hypothetical protein
MARSAMNALDAGVSIDGEVFSGLALIGIPAEVYPDQPKPSCRRLFSGGRRNPLSPDALFARGAIT